MKAFKEVVKDIESKVTNLKNSISSLKQENSELKSTLEVLENRLEEKVTELNDCHTKINHLTLELEESKLGSSIKNDVSDEEVTALVREIDECINVLKQK